jgi:hypothetical protein
VQRGAQRRPELAVPQARALSIRYAVGHHVSRSYLGHCRSTGPCPLREQQQHCSDSHDAT